MLPAASWESWPHLLSQKGKGNSEEPSDLLKVTGPARDGDTAVTQARAQTFSARLQGPREPTGTEPRPCSSPHWRSGLLQGQAGVGGKEP